MVDPIELRCLRCKGERSVMRDGVSGYCGWCFQEHRDIQREIAAAKIQLDFVEGKMAKFMADVNRSKTNA